MEYVIYNKATGEILRTVNCPENIINIQLQTGENYIEGDCDDIIQKVIDGIIVDKTQAELDDYNFEQVENTIPVIDTSLSDAELEVFLDDYFIGRVDIKQWRIDNYAILRKLHYPNQDEFIDSFIKLNSKISELEIQGQVQLDNYVQKCLNVKTKFLKE